MAKSLQLKYVAWLCLALCWCTVAEATENQLVVGIAAIPIEAIRNVLVLSAVGGLGGTLARICRPDIIVRNLPLEICRDAVLSVLGGMLMFFFTSWIPSVISFWPQAILITVAGYANSKVVDLFSEESVAALRTGLQTLLRRMLGIAPTDKP